MSSARRDPRHRFGARFPGRREPRTDRRGGFGLVDVMIAMSVILVSMTVLYQALLSGQILSADNKLRHRALQDASSLMEQMSVVPLPNLSATFAHDAPIAEFAGLHCPNQSVRVVYEDAAAATVPPVNYRVISTWTSTVGRPETLVLRGVRAR